MKHKHINRKQCLLYHLDELSEKEKNRLIKRIGSCDQCQQRLRDEEILIQNIYQFPLLTPAKAYRDKIRNLLLSSLKKITHRSDKQITRTIQGIVPILHYPKIQWAAAVAILILGIVIGHFGLPMKNNTIPFAQEFEALSPDSMPVTNIKCNFSDFIISL